MFGQDATSCARTFRRGWPDELYSVFLLLFAVSVAIIRFLLYATCHAARVTEDGFLMYYLNPSVNFREIFYFP